MRASARKSQPATGSRSLAGTTLNAERGLAIVPLGSEPIVIEVSNTDVDPHAVIMRALAGGVDLVAICDAGARVRLGPFDPERYRQADGTIWVDLEAGHTGEVWADPV